MWSGPRNLSTAMMRSFGSRPDCKAVDEPFYAAYLAATGIDHPMRAEIIANGQTDPAIVIKQCLCPPSSGLIYQKHMTHHMIPEFDLSWIAGVTNVFLIRSPERVLASYAKKRQAVTAADIGFERQREIFDEARERVGEAPAVIDSTDLLRNPEPMLRRLCERLSIKFYPAMLSWPPGPRPEDGIWAAHWYDAVWKSTGFAPPEKENADRLADPLRRISESVYPDYEYLRGFCLSA